MTKPQDYNITTFLIGDRKRGSMKFKMRMNQIKFIDSLFVSSSQNVSFFNYTLKKHIRLIIDLVKCSLFHILLFPNLILLLLQRCGWRAASPFFHTVPSFLDLES